MTFSYYPGAIWPFEHNEKNSLEIGYFCILIIYLQNPNYESKLTIFLEPVGN